MTKEILAALIDAKAEEIKHLAELFSTSETETSLVCVERLRGELIGSNPDISQVKKLLTCLGNTKGELLFSYSDKGIILYQKVMEFIGMCDIFLFKSFRYP